MIIVVHIFVWYGLIGWLLIAIILLDGAPLRAYVNGVETKFPGIRKSWWFWPVLVLGIFIIALSWPRCVGAAWTLLKSLRVR